MYAANLPGSFVAVLAKIGEAAAVHRGASVGGLVTLVLALVGPEQSGEVTYRETSGALYTYPSMQSIAIAPGFSWQVN